MSRVEVPRPKIAGSLPATTSCNTSIFVADILVRQRRELDLHVAVGLATTSPSRPRSPATAPPSKSPACPALARRSTVSPSTRRLVFGSRTTAIHGNQLGRSGSPPSTISVTSIAVLVRPPPPSMWSGAASLWMSSTVMASSVHQIGITHTDPLVQLQREDVVHPVLVGLGRGISDIRPRFSTGTVRGLH